jgi:glycosyltransferase involved in cell wall biosynthesis
MIHALSLADAVANDSNETALPHVLLVLDQFPKTLGGGERIVLRLAALLPKYGYRASILTFFVHPECNALTSAPCPIYVLPLQRTYDLNAFKAALELRRFLTSQRVQIVQTFFESSDIWAGFVTKMTSKAKLIWSRRDMGILRAPKHHAAYRMMAGVPDAVFSVSAQVSRYCIEVDRIAPARIHTIYNGLDLDDHGHVASPLAAHGKVCIATLGNIRRVKGHDLLVRAAAVVLRQFPEVSFRIAGEVLEPDYFSELESLVRDLGIGNSFHFVGGVTDTRKYLHNADIFVLPSRSEGFSNAIVEAMAASLPVIATNVGGNAEAVVDGATGLVIPAEDSEALAAAIVQLLSEPTQARAMGIAGRSRAAEVFTTEAMMKQIVGVYDRLLAP